MIERAMIKLMPVSIKREIMPERGWQRAGKKWREVRALVAAIDTGADGKSTASNI